MEHLRVPSCWTLYTSFYAAQPSVIFQQQQVLEQSPIHKEKNPTFFMLLKFVLPVSFLVIFAVFVPVIQYRFHE